MMQGMTRQDLPDGSSLLTMPYDEGLAQKAVTKKLKNQTPDPSTDDSKSGASDSSGPIRRFNDVFTDIGSIQLEQLGLDGFEIAKSIQKRNSELFRNDFPLIVPRFTVKCVDCDAEFDNDVDECTDCGSQALRGPRVEQKREAQRLFESVNKEGQSLGSLMELCEDDHGRIGVAAFIVKKQYRIASGDTDILGKPVFQEGEVISEDVDELVRADPKRTVPVTDENGRIGGWKWTCPVHRQEALRKDDKVVPGQSTCPECGAQLREIYFAEKEYVGGRDAKKYYFEDEVITWAHFFPRQHGLDGLSPVHHIWLKQAVLHWMDIYAAAFYDPNSDKYPNKFMVVHTTNAESWERNFEQAEDEASDNLYAQQIFVNEYAVDSQSTPELQTIDLMDDELRGQNDAIKKRYKSDIRQQFGVTDVFDSELEDAGGLNNEGLQLEVTDRHVASAQKKLMRDPLDELMKILGYTDYRVTFVPPQVEDLDSLEQKIKIGTDAANAGLDARLEDEELEIDDGEFEESSTGAEGAGGLFAQEHDDEEWEHASEKLSEGFEHLVWSEVDTKADPFWDEDSRVPDAVQELIKEAIRDGAIFESIDGVSASSKLEDFFEEKLTQPQGWSLSSIANDLQSKFDIAEDQAATVARTESASILNNAREKSYERLGVEDEAQFKWIGPDDHRTTDACEWLKEQTKDGVTMERLVELEKEAQEKFFPNLDTFRRHVVHPEERHTFTESFKMDHPSADDIEVEIDTVPGTFEVAT